VTLPPVLDALAAAIREALATAGLPDAEPRFERPRSREHGDWATNVALALAKPAGVPPREVASRLLAALPPVDGVAALEVAGPGFVNVRLAHDVLERAVRDAVALGSDYGRVPVGPGAPRINVEFVSANPTGPLHIGAGRWAATGDALAALLEAAGSQVSREYYFNDAGEQMRRFGDSVAAAMRGEPPPPDGYRGSYIAEIAAACSDAGLDADDLDAVRDHAYGLMLQRITATLEAFGVHFDTFFGERTLHESGAVTAVVERLRQAGHVYESDGATWLRTTSFGDDKDRVLVKADGEPTYFAADCAYLESKAARGFDRSVLLLGADHHGYVGRMQALAAALGMEPDGLEILIGQLVSFTRGGEVVAMSKRSGDFITVDDLLEEVGRDAARYTFVRTSMDQALEFDLAAVVRTERDNPVYYVQYSHARIAAIVRRVEERGVDVGAVEDADLSLLTHPTEVDLLTAIGRWPEVVARAASERAPHRVARYCEEELAERFHRFYESCLVLGEDVPPPVTRARYWLCVAARLTLVNALGVLGVSAPERM
jgi:arginyl-tRNA synthetase